MKSLPDKVTDIRQDFSAVVDAVNRGPALNEKREIFPSLGTATDTTFCLLSVVFIAADQCSK